MVDVGKSSKPTIGYWHYMGLYMGECSGPANALRAIECGGEIAWTGDQTESGVISINKPMLFGGEKKEGGIVGTLEVRMGEETQMPSAYLQSKVPGPWPAARGLVTSVFNGIVGAMNPYVKLWKKQWSRWDAGWKTPVWEPTLVKVGEGTNGAHIIYEAFSDPDCGAGYSTELIDTDQMLIAAQTLHDEGFGLCLKWARSEPVLRFINIVCEHIGGAWYEDPKTAKVGLTLFRGDYDPDALELLDETNIVKMEAWQQPMLDGSVNEVTVVGRDCMTNKDISATYQNLANVQAQGRVVSDKRQLPGLWNEDLIKRAAARECITASSLLCRVKIQVKAELWGIKRGDVRALSWKRRGVVRMPVRVLEVDEGTLEDSTIGLMVTQDISGMAATTYIKPVVGGWVPPDKSPQPLTAQRLVEASYRDLAGTFGAADLAAVEPDASYLVALGARTSGIAYGYDLTTRIGSAAFTLVAGGDFSPTGLLSGDISRTTSTFTLAGGQDLDLVEVGSEAMVDDEKMVVTAIDPETSSVSVGRGCVDTVAVPHLAGARMWFTDNFIGADPTEYVGGETVNAKLLTRTAQGTLDPGLATTLNLTMAHRQSLPYPPGQLRINGVSEPASASDVISVGWAHRDRVLQADQLVDDEVASIGPEPNVRYALRFLDASAALLVEKLDIATTSVSATAVLDYTGVVTMQLYAINNSGGSFQRLERTFTYTPPAGPVVSAITAPTWTPTVTIIDGNDPP